MGWTATHPPSRWLRVSNHEEDLHRLVPDDKPVARLRRALRRARAVLPGQAVCLQSLQLGQAHEHGRFTVGLTREILRPFGSEGDDRSSHRTGGNRPQDLGDVAGTLLANQVKGQHTGGVGPGKRCVVLGGVGAKTTGPAVVVAGVAGLPEHCGGKDQKLRGRGGPTCEKNTGRNAGDRSGCQGSPAGARKAAFPQVEPSDEDPFPVMALAREAADWIPRIEAALKKRSEGVRRTGSESRSPADREFEA